MNILIVGAGEVWQEGLCKLYSKSDYVICVDGGSKVFKKFNLSADLYLGDFDSTTTENHLYMLNHSKKVLEFPAEKNKTDLEIALDIAVERKCDKINILGATGSRLDHTLSNINLLSRYFSEKVQITLYSEHHEIFYAECDVDIFSNKQYFSVFPISKEGAVISMSGCKYPLNNQIIAFASSIGVSNEFIDRTVHIEVHRGGILIFLSNEEE